MADEPEVIRHQMEATRASLSEKVELLEQHVVQTMQEATTAVADTVENIKEAAQETVNTVKDTMHETVQTVRDTLDVPLQVRRRPWTMMAASVGAGFLGGMLLQRSRRRSVRTDREQPRPVMPARLTASPVGEERRRPAVEAKPSWLNSVAETLAPEIDKLRGLAVGTLVSVVRDLVTPQVPPTLRPRVNELFEDFTVKLGGQPIQGPILESREPREKSAGQEADFARHYTNGGRAH